MLSPIVRSLPQAGSTACSIAITSTRASRSADGIVARSRSRLSGNDHTLPRRQFSIPRRLSAIAAPVRRRRPQARSRLLLRHPDRLLSAGHIAVANRRSGIRTTGGGRRVFLRCASVAHTSMGLEQPSEPVLRASAGARADSGGVALANSEGQAFGVERVFIEPTSPIVSELSSPVLGFQGCRAARHDDHIHIQIGRRKMINSARWR